MAYTGLTAKLNVEIENQEKTIAYISNWSIDETRDVVEITELGKATKEVKPTLLYWSGSAEGAVDFADEKGQKELRTLMANGNSVKMYFYLDEKVCLIGNAIITALSFGASSEDKSTISISVTGDGALTLDENHVQATELAGGAGA